MIKDWAPTRALSFIFEIREKNMPFYEKKSKNAIFGSTFSLMFYQKERRSTYGKKFSIREWIPR